MRFAIMAAALCLSLAGCAGQVAAPAPILPAPIVTIAGPSFAATAFDCGKKPLPPAAATPSANEGSSAARYETSLAAFADCADNKLHSAGRTLLRAGQVVK